MTLDIERSILRYYAKSVEKKDVREVENDIAATYENLCSVHSMMKEDQQAIKYANKAINILNTSKMGELTKQKHMKNLEFMMAYLQKIRDEEDGGLSPEGDDKR